MQVRVSTAIKVLADNISALANINGDPLIELTIGYRLDADHDDDDTIMLSPPTAWLEEVPLCDGLEDAVTDEVVHFLYRKEGYEATRDDMLAFMIDDEIRVGSVIKHDSKNRRVMIWDYDDNQPKWYKWDNACCVSAIQFGW